jgi:hypothetical protein
MACAFASPTAISIDHAIYYLNHNGYNVRKYSSQAATCATGNKNARYYVAGNFLNAGGLRKLVYDMMVEKA